MKLTRDWRATRDGLVLSMNLEVEGKVLVANVVQEDRGYRSSPPAEYIERELRHNLMRELERTIFGSTR